jgi:hypothetical protein
VDWNGFFSNNTKIILVALEGSPVIVEKAGMVASASFAVWRCA